MADKADELKTKANQCVAKSDFAGAVQALTEALALTPNAKDLWSNRAFAYSSLGRHQDALNDAKQCVKLAPTFSKGYLRAGRALIALGRCDDAADLLEDAYDKMPQDYSLKEALADAEAAAANAASGSSANPAAAATPLSPSSASSKDAANSGKNVDGGLNSSYYYAAVGAADRKLPMNAPPKIEPQRIDPVKVNGVASGHVKEDIERKGSDSYYYAHDRKTDFTVPTVPKKINADGSMTPYNIS